MASDTGGAAGTGPAVEDMSYTDASAELDEIVRFFEQREVDVDQLVGRLVRATAIIEELDKRLRRTRVQVDQLVPRLSAVLGESAGDDQALVGVADAEPAAGAEPAGGAEPGEDTASPAGGDRRADDDASIPGLF